MIGRHRRSSKHGQDVEVSELSWTTTQRFKKAVAGIIVLNTIVIIIHAFLIQMQLAVFNYLDLAFTAFYVLELICCLADQGIRRYLCNDDWWNWFDLFITVLCVVDLATVTITAGTSMTRLLRLFRILRVVRGLRFLNELDYVLVQIARATCKLALLVSMMLLISSMIATNLLWDCDDPTIAGMFENLGKSLWTMFKIMTLDQWIEMVDVVVEVKPEMIWFFILFIFSTGISLMSLAPAMFIDISLKQNEHEDFVQQERARSKLRKDKQKLLLTLFHLTDEDNNGRISVDELKSVITNDCVLQELQNRGISQAKDLEEVRLGLFDVFEENMYRSAENQQEEISMEEFTDGILRMHEDLSQAKLWRSTTSTRLMLRDFAAVVLGELEQLQHTLHSSFEASQAQVHANFMSRWHIPDSLTPKSGQQPTGPTESPDSSLAGGSNIPAKHTGSMEVSRRSQKFARHIGLDSSLRQSSSVPFVRQSSSDRKMLDRLATFAELDPDQDRSAPPAARISQEREPSRQSSADSSSELLMTL